MRVWVRGMPGADETEVVAGVLTEVTDSRARLTVRTPDGAERALWVVPHEPGWGFHALWFSFIAVDVFELRGSADEPLPSEAIARWFIRLGTP